MAIRGHQRSSQVACPGAYHLMRMVIRGHQRSSQVACPGTSSPEETGHQTGDQRKGRYEGDREAIRRAIRREIRRAIRGRGDQRKGRSEGDRKRPEGSDSRRGCSQRGGSQRVVQSRRLFTSLGARSPDHWVATRLRFDLLFCGGVVFAGGLDAFFARFAASATSTRWCCSRGFVNECFVNECGSEALSVPSRLADACPTL